MYPHSLIDGASWAQCCICTSERPSASIRAGFPGHKIPANDPCVITSPRITVAGGHFLDTEFQAITRIWVQDLIGPLSTTMISSGRWWKRLVDLQRWWNSIPTGTADLDNSYLAWLLSPNPRLRCVCAVLLSESWSGQDNSQGQASEYVWMYSQTWWTKDITDA